MEDDDFEHKTIDEVLESEQKKKKRQKLLEKVRISSFVYNFLVFFIEV